MIWFLNLNAYYLHTHTKKTVVSWLWRKWSGLFYIFFILQIFTHPWDFFLYRTGLWANLPPSSPVSGASLQKITIAGIVDCWGSFLEGRTGQRRKGGEGQGYQRSSQPVVYSMWPPGGALTYRREGLGGGVPSTQPWGSHHPCWVQTFQCWYLKVTHAPAHNPSPTIW